MKLSPLRTALETVIVFGIIGLAALFIALTD